ncbi:MAG: S8 family serine peptidase [Verrucomicrobiaceae bacterium]|nr:S8 family serine peptidase [Verrucomicrobiaceae bacterium]
MGSDPQFPSVVWPDLEQARAALRSGTGEGVKVAIIDSGVDLSHPALAGLELEDDLTVSCDGINLHIREGRGTDLYGHGTAVASLVRREAPRAKLGSFRALDSSNHARSFVIAECVNQAINRGYQVINCSFGCRGLPRYVMDYKEWVDRAYLEGVQVVAACSNIDVGIREWPAYFPSVISVRGIDCAPDAFYFRPGRMVSFLACGERVEVPLLRGEKKIETGSSYAAPLIAGKIARLLSELPGIDPAAVKPLLSVLAEPA